MIKIIYYIFYIVPGILLQNKMCDSIFTLINKINDSEKLSAKYVCLIGYSLANAYNNSHQWTIEITGKDTYANKS